MGHGGGIYRSLIILTYVSWAGGAHAANYYASPSGQGATCSLSAPCSLSAVSSLAQANDFVYLRGGTYWLSSPIYPRSGQTWQNYNDEAVRLRGDNVRSAFSVTGLSDVTIRGFTVDGAQSSGISVSSSTNINILNSTITNFNLGHKSYRHGVVYATSVGGRIANLTVYGGNTGEDGTLGTIGGIAMVSNSAAPEGVNYGGGTAVEDNHVYGPQLGVGIWADINSGCSNCVGGRHLWRRNLIENTFSHGIRLETGSSAVVRENIIKNAGRHGIALRACRNIDGAEVLNNVFYLPTWFAVHVEESVICNSATKLTHFKVQNNIFYLANRMDAVAVAANTSADPSNLVDHNLFFNTGGNLAICWNRPSTSGSLGCPVTAGAIEYTSSQLDQFHQDTRGSGSIWADPTFENPPSDFHLRENSPAKCAAAGGDEDMGAYPGACSALAPEPVPVSDVIAPTVSIVTPVHGAAVSLESATGK